MGDQGVQNASLHLYNGGVLRLKLSNQQFCGPLRLDGSAAGEDVHRSVAVLGPRMNGNVRLKDDNHTADATIRGKGVKRLVDYGSLCFARGGKKRHSQEIEVAQALPVAAVQFEEHMPRQGSQSATSLVDNTQ